MNPPENLPPFCAVLLAGGRSTRMGRDKAGLMVDGAPLWQRQLATLRALAPRELFISGRRDGPYAGAGIEIVEDETPGLGPLGGIATALRHARADRVLVLAIDLPAMTSDFLGTLVNTGRGCLPHDGAHFEPLAAVYPRSALALADEQLRAGDRTMQRFAQRLADAGLADIRKIPAADARLFRNLNRPEDLA